MREKIAAFWKKETVLCVSLAAALLSFLLTPPSRATLASVDVDVLMLLFSLMAVVAGLRRAGLMDRAAGLLGRGGGTARTAAALLVALCFFAAMLLTNDVALIAFVPLALAALDGSAARARVVILMTVAANLGSMATPIGNPQNLFLYTHFGLGIGAFWRIVWPTVLLSALLLAAALLAVPPERLAPAAAEALPPLDDKRLALHGALLAACLLAVLDALPVWAAFALVLLLCLALDRAALRGVDWALLATFACFFLLAGNLSGSPAVRGFAQRRMQGEGEALCVSAGLSQIISNVPAAVLLSSFTNRWEPLLLGVDIGGLGTPVASLASLISFRLYARGPGARPGRYMREFLLWNLAFLLILLAAARAQLAFFA